MRDPQRIHKMVADLQELWDKMPDMRLGQLVYNIYRSDATPGSGSPDLFYLEDDEFMKRLERFKKEYVDKSV